jgi:hypothetical protein
MGHFSESRESRQKQYQTEITNVWRKAETHAIPPTSGPPYSDLAASENGNSQDGLHNPQIAPADRETLNIGRDTMKDVSDPVSLPVPSPVSHSPANLDRIASMDLFDLSETDGFEVEEFFRFIDEMSLDGKSGIICFVFTESKKNYL